MSDTFNFDLLDNQTVRKERVFISAGPLWVWELLTDDWTMIHRRATRPAEHPLGGTDEYAAVMAQIQFSCHLSDDEKSPLMFLDEKGPVRIGKLKKSDFETIMAAFHRVNGTDPSEVEEEKAFFAATEDGRSGSSEPSASAVSVG